MSRPPGDSASVTVYVDVDPATAFSVFTEEIDLWWRRGPRFRASGKLPGVLRFEPRVGGRLFETVEGPHGPREYTSGQITVWDPPRRLCFDWQTTNFAPDENTRVEVDFEATREGTRVRLTHSGWAALRDDHPVRHGKLGPAHAREVGRRWGDLLKVFRRLIVDRADGGGPFRS